MAFVFRKNYNRINPLFPNSNVGPGSYRFQKYKAIQSPAPFNSSQRKAFKSMSVSPGPAHYSISTHSNNKKKPLPHRLSIQKKIKKEVLPNLPFELKLPQLIKKRSPKSNLKNYIKNRSTPSIPSKVIREIEPQQKRPKKERNVRKPSPQKSRDLNYIWQFLMLQKNKQSLDRKKTLPQFKVLHIYKVEEILKQPPSPPPGPADYSPQNYQSSFKNEQHSLKFQFFLNGSPRFKETSKGIEVIRTKLPEFDLKRQTRKKLRLIRFNHSRIISKLFSSETPIKTIHKYPYQGKITKIRSHTLPHRQEHPDPGPGAYHASCLLSNKKRQRSQEQIMSSLKPTKNEGKEGPSPMSYFMQRYKSIAAINKKLNFPPFMSKTSRFKQSKSYSGQRIQVQQPQSSRSSQGYKFQMAPKESIFSQNLNKGPGPGSYFRRLNGGLLRRSFNKLFNKI